MSAGLLQYKQSFNDPTLEATSDQYQQATFGRNLFQNATFVPLSVAFVADDGTVVNIDDMKPQTTDSHCSAKPVRFVLEMNQGWFAKRGIKTGAKLQGAPFGH